VHDVDPADAPGRPGDHRTVFVVPWVDGDRPELPGPVRRRTRRAGARGAHAAPGPAVPVPVPTQRPVRLSAAPAEDVRVEGSVRAEGWETVVWNDPVNLMSYVTYVFRSYFGYTQERAEQLMLQVHREGRATVSRGNREQMEIDVQAMHGFGLWATMQSVDG
jgi:ATP-dependent Clp protease adaptor protein ClpS